MSSRLRLLFLQLPRLDPDVRSPGENVMLAAACLGSALARSDEGRHWQVLGTPALQECADNRSLAAAILQADPDAVAATLYVWNVERTLRLLSALRRQRPHLRCIVGGPEVAVDHPFLMRTRALDAAVTGEGESILPGVLHGVRTGCWPDWRELGHRTGQVWVWGRRRGPQRPLVELAPVPTHPVNRPDAHGMAYLETNRGCPLRCAFCCYNLRRRGWSSLPPAAVVARVRVLRARGAREIRLVDPTFNAHPQFQAVLKALARVNADGRVAFFVELRAETLTAEDVRLLKAAHVAEAEVGVQSTDPAVLRAIHRPTRLDRVAAGIALLEQAGIRPTIDFMYGLPRQNRRDLDQSLDWLAQHPQAHPQFLPTLLLPGTELRLRRRTLGLRAQPRPPYRVLATRDLSANALAEVEQAATLRLGSFDTPTRRFVGRHLSDLFPERVHLPADAVRTCGRVLGRANRRAVLLAGDNLFARQAELAGLICRAVRHEPDVLWQFVLQPAHEEPLDLLEHLAQTIQGLPTHWLDRLVSPGYPPRCAARRLLVRLPSRPPFDPGWCADAEELLRSSFH